ncbi:hypothetical protein L218DRAFT_876373, partial [Marasmius fiardii PR-910]
IVIEVNGKPCRALVDTGSLGDFISTQVADRLGVRKRIPGEAFTFAHGSPRALIRKSTVEQQWTSSYQNIDSTRYFDIANHLGYVLILGAPWLFVYQV